METPPPAPAPKERRWPTALLVGFVTAIGAVVAIVPIGDWAMQMHHVSNMEGGRGFAMIGCWMPLALLVGFVTGFVVSLVTAGRGFAGYLKRQGIAIGVLALLIAATAGISYSSADHPPLFDGKTLALEIQVRVPTKGRTVEDLRTQDFTIALVVSASDRSYSDMRWSEAQQEGDFIIVPAWAPLNSRNAGREITAGVAGENRQIFNVMLWASPKISESWSEWAPPRALFDGSKPAPEDQYMARYRVRFETEYSPTPSPTAEPAPTVQEGTEPEETPDGTGL